MNKSQVSTTGTPSEAPQDPAGVPASHGVDAAPFVAPLDMAVVLLKHWKLASIPPAVALVIAAALSLLMPRKFTATASFTAELESAGRTLPSSLAGLATQFGIGLGATSTSPQLYADVLQSRTIRDQILAATFVAPSASDGTATARLLDILGIRGKSELERFERGRRKLEKLVAVRVSPKTGIVSISVETPYPDVSAAVANEFVVFLNRFNLETRQSTVRDRRVFIEARLREAEEELRTAEDEAQRFLQRNREFRGSAELNFQYERLQRQLAVKQEVLVTLRRQYEEARIQEVNDNPVITVIDQAVKPQRKSSPKLMLNVLLAVLLAATGSVIACFMSEYVARARNAHPDLYHEVLGRWRALRSDMTSLVRR